MTPMWMSVEHTYIWWFYIDCEWLKLCGYDAEYG